ncbi:hypothetical protein KCU90_g17027, partial [Aureobasidium melanogenum]
MRTSIALNSIAFALSAAALPLNASSNASNITTPAGMYLADNGAILPILARRQDIDFDLVDEAPEPTVAIDDSSNYNQQAAIDAVVSEVEANPLPQRRDTDLHRRDIVVETSSGYTSNVQIQDAAISAPKNCQGSDTFLGSKLFTTGPFDTTLCAAACTAQSEYNVRHPPAGGVAKTCQFYNTYAMYRNGVYQGQYCAMYTQAWDASYAKNDGQWRGSVHYTMGLSYIASNATQSGDVSCPSDVPYLSESGAAFCTVFLDYNPPTSTVSTVTVTPAVSVLTSTQSNFVTTTVYDTQLTTDVQTATVTRNMKRDVQTPASLSTWSPSRISAACSSVATGTETVTATETAATPLSTTFTTQVITQTQTIPTTVVVKSTTTKSVDPIATPIEGLNIIQNPSFENGQDYWSVEYPGGFSWTSNGEPWTYAGAAQTGSSYAVYHVAGGSLDWVQTLTGLSNTAAYHLTFYTHTLLNANPCSMQVLLGSDVLLNVALSDSRGYGPTGYDKRDVDVHPTAYTEQLRIRMTCSGDETANMFLDSVSFYAV